MALIFHSSSTLLPKETTHLHLHIHTPLLHFPTTKPTHQFLIKSQSSSSSSSSSSTEPPKPTTTTPPIDGPRSATNPLPKTPTSTPRGFGSKANAVGAKKKQRGGRERVIQRRQVEKPGFVAPREGAQAKEESTGEIENAFLLAWLGLGSVILIEGIALAASGFLPEEWDKFLVKYLYPVFTPTVFLFFAGTVTYGVLKYLENEKLKKQQ